MPDHITNPNGAFGYTDLLTKAPSEVDTFLTSAAVTGGRVVAIGTDAKVAVAATNGTAALCVGVAISDIASGATGNVVTRGLAENVLAEGTIAAGDIVKRSATTTGAVAATATPAAGEGIGVAINASAGGTVDVWLSPRALS